MARPSEMESIQGTCGEGRAAGGSRAGSAQHWAPLTGAQQGGLWSGGLRRTARRRLVAAKSPHQVAQRGEAAPEERGRLLVGLLVVLLVQGVGVARSRRHR